MEVITNKLKARFCKDCSLPINIYDEPYFTDRIELCDKQYNSKEKWEVLKRELKKYSNEREYLDENDEIREKAILSIKNTDGWNKFNSEDMNKYGTTDLKFPSSNIYKGNNDGKLFLSVDMKHANFSALKHYDENIFKVGENICNTWEEFIGQFTDNEHIINSKYIRQVVMGNCNPKRTITYEKSIMASLIRGLGTNDIVSNIVSFAADEVIFDLSGYDYNTVDNRINTIENVINDIGVPLKIQTFTLHKINGTDGFIKKYIKGKDGIDIKCLNSLFIPFVLRALNKEDVTESDRTFIHEGMLSRVVEVPKISITI